MKHQIDHGDVDHRFATDRIGFVVLAQPAILAEPAERPFHNPTFGQRHKAADRNSLDDLDHPSEHLPGFLHKIAGVTSVGPDDLQAAEQSGHFLQHLLTAIAVLDVRRMHAYRENQPERIDNNMPLSPGDFLAGIVPMSSSFCGAAVLTDCESMIAAEGVGLRPARRRTFSRNLS